MTNEIDSAKRRPIGVWLVSIFYVLSAGLTLLAFLLIFGDVITVTPDQETYFASLSAVDWLLSLAIAVVGVSAALFLFLLRRVAIILFSLELTLNIASIAFALLRTNWIEAVGASGLVGAIVGLLIPVAVILYSLTLARRGVLS